MIREALLYETLAERMVHCYLCSHHCRIENTEFGFCGMRENRDGTLYTHAYGEVIAAHVDPVEKKPFFHVLPGTSAFSVAAPGCNFHCSFCQNWRISQITKEHQDSLSGIAMPPEEIVRNALANNCRSIAYTYTEPTIFFEYAAEIARLARDAGLCNLFVTNGYMTREALETIGPYLDACNVDLKSFRENFYTSFCRGHLTPVLQTIRRMKEMGIWVEITTLVIPGTNDSEAELLDIARFIAELDPGIPWHVSRFHPDYQFTEAAPTPLEALDKAYDTGICEGLRYVYISNVTGDREHTLCHGCGTTVIRRQGLMVRDISLRGSCCSHCGTAVAGIFNQPVKERKTA